MTSEVSKIEEIALSGAGAIVLKSIFEEQINMDASKALTDNSYPESADYIQNYIRANTVQQHIDLVKAVKNKVNIPVIASINCLRDGEWISFASELEKAGADALELNAFILPMDEFAESVEVENMYFQSLLRTGYRYRTDSCRSGFCVQYAGRFEDNFALDRNSVGER